jgi:hypothetical protein
MECRRAFIHMLRRGQTYSAKTCRALTRALMIKKTYLRTYSEGGTFSIYYRVSVVISVIVFLDIEFATCALAGKVRF